MADLEALEEMLWFDAYLRCDAIEVDEPVEGIELWFDAYLRCDAMVAWRSARPRSCDLMLIWDVMQSTAKSKATYGCCDLMLIWDVMQFNCLILILLFRCDLMLIWDVMQLVHIPEWPVDSCDLMLIWDVMQSPDNKPRVYAVVIWCLFEMWCNCFIAVSNHHRLWFDAYLRCDAIAASAKSRTVKLWFDAYLRCDAMDVWQGVWM